METLKLREDFIKLGQALKATGMVESGVEAKLVIQDGPGKGKRRCGDTKRQEAGSRGPGRI